MSGPREKKVSAPTKERAAALTTEQEAEILEIDADPYGTLQDIAESAGMSQGKARDLVNVIRAKYHPISTELKKVKVGQLVDVIEDRAYRALQHLDDEKLAASSARDLAVTMGILLEKRQLLRGEPTQIIGLEERLQLNELVPELVRELGRRGMNVGEGLMDTVDGPIVDITPQPVERHGVKGTRVKGSDGHRLQRNKISKEVGEPTHANTE